MSQLDGDSFRAMDELHHNMIKEQEKEAVLKGYATSHHTSISSLRSHHLAPSLNGDPGSSTTQHFDFSTPPQSPRQSQTQYYNLTLPQSPRQQPLTPPVIPSVHQHYAHIPDPPNQSATRKVLSKIEKKEMKRISSLKEWQMMTLIKTLKSNMR